MSTKAQVWAVTMEGWLPEDVLRPFCEEFRTTADSEDRTFLLRGATPEAALHGGLQGGLQGGVSVEPWGFGGEDPPGGARFCVRVGGFGEPELVTVTPVTLVRTWPKPSGPHVYYDVSSLTDCRPPRVVAVEVEKLLRHARYVEAVGPQRRARVMKNLAGESGHIIPVTTEPRT